MNLRLQHAWVAAVLAALAMGCGDDDRPPGSIQGSGGTSAAGGRGGSGGGVAGSGGGSGGTAGTSPDGGAGVLEGGLPDAPDDVPSRDVDPDSVVFDGPLGTIPVFDIPDQPCVAAQATPVELYPPGTDQYFERLVKFGDRRAAGSILTGMVVVFDPASPVPQELTLSVRYNLFDTEGDTLGVVAATNEDEILFQRYDDAVQPVGATVSLATEPPGRMTIASRTGESLVVWAARGNIRARGVAASGQPVGPAFDIATDAFQSVIFVVAAPAANGYAVAWVVDDDLLTYGTHLAFVTPDGTIQSRVELMRLGWLQPVLKLVARPQGFALLVGGQPPSYTPYVVRLDASGGVVTPAYSMPGALYGWDLAARGDDVGLTSARADLVPQFRAFDASMNPLGPPVCLAGAGVLGDLAAVDGDGDGYIVLARTPEGATVMHTFDASGGPR